jgi:hypothetical protein
MVRRTSALGAGRSSMVGGGEWHLPGLHHFSLLNHPHVYDLLRTWLDAPPVFRGPAASET